MFRVSSSVFCVFGSAHALFSAFFFGGGGGGGGEGVVGSEVEIVKGSGMRFRMDAYMKRPGRGGGGGGWLMPYHDRCGLHCLHATPV